MPLNLGLGEIMVILVVALLVFGGRLPQVGRSLGRGLSEFKKGFRGIEDPPGDSPPQAPPPEQITHDASVTEASATEQTPPATGPEQEHQPS